MQEDQLPPYLRAPFPTLGRRGVAVSDHPLASQAACDVIEAGGNAVDAAVAMSFALGCCCPYYAGIGGGGFALVWMPGWLQPRWLDFREVAPAAAHPHTYLELPEEACYLGRLSVGVPGSVAGLHELHSQLGRLPWAGVLDPAIAVAERGVRVDPNWYRISLAKEQGLSQWPEASRIYLREGKSPFPGIRLPLTDLAASYRMLAEHGPDYFYRGPIAESIVACLDGWMTPQDLAGYRVKWRTPLQMDWQGGQLYTVSSPSAGGLQLLQVLGLMQRLGVGWEEDAYYDRLAQAMRLSFLDRGQSAGDPDFGAPDPCAFLRPEWFDQWPLAGPALSCSTGGTASHAVATEDGGVVIFTESINHWFGSMLVAPGTGILLNDTMDDFSTHPERPDQFGLTPAHWNQVQPGKRPVSSSAPAIWMDRGLPRLLAGSAGGPRITTSVAQILLAVRALGCNVQQAVTAPRMHHQWLPDYLEVEPNFPQSLRQALQARGHRLLERACRSHAAAIECHWDDGFFSAGHDFRSWGGARGL